MLFGEKARRKSQMSNRNGVPVRRRNVRAGRCEETLLLGIIVLAALYPVLREAAHAVAPVWCGMPASVASDAGRQALVGKIACALALAVLIPAGARALAGSWIALARTSAYRLALGVAGISTATLTAFDVCTGFHAAGPMAEGCTCWLTALLVGVAALLTVLLILGGRAILALLRDAIGVILEAFFGLQHIAAPRFSSRREVVPLTAGALLARRCAGRGPPVFGLHFA
jgi:hypothetical protein